MELLNITQKVSAPGGTKSIPKVDIPSAYSKCAKNSKVVNGSLTGRLKFWLLFLLTRQINLNRFSE
jgi:hypothetical protein